ncbi:hypothetical protein [Streptacidiphilus sp. EB129]|uniref:hypothetical protein n=1 Tax=Streptacidiphilus sp. EB129 TaxID=3156262 RepID=UPI003516F9FA
MTSRPVQRFSSAQKLMPVGLGQWSDGHSSDYQHLEEVLSPLVDAVNARLMAGS